MYYLQQKTYSIRVTRLQSKVSPAGAVVFGFGAVALDGDTGGAMLAAGAGALAFEDAARTLVLSEAEDTY